MLDSQEVFGCRYAQRRRKKVRKTAARRLNETQEKVVRCGVLGVWPEGRCSPPVGRQDSFSYNALSLIGVDEPLAADVLEVAMLVGGVISTHPAMLR